MKSKTPKKPHKKKKEWGLKDFVKSVDEVMQKQEKENLGLKQVHARLSPEWNRVSEKISRLLSLNDETAVDSLREEIVCEGEIATRVLTDLLLAIKQQAQRS